MRDIFFVSNSVNELGGVTSWSHQMARLFAERGHRVHVIGITEPDVAQHLGDDLPYPTTTLYETRPGRVWRPRRFRDRFNVAARRRQAARDAGMREQAAKMTELFRAAAPGGMVIVTQVWAMEWVRLADTHGMPVIGMSHESFEYSMQSSRFGRVKRYFGEADRLLLLTQEDADLWIRRQGLNNVGVMPNPLPFMPEHPSPRTEKVVASIGRLHDQKGIDMLLDAWAEVTGRFPGWTLRIYGSGEDEPALREQCTALGLDGSVMWMGQTKDVPEAMREASVFVQSSRGEGFPLAILEAMACGLPCAAFDCAPGVREIIADGEDGLLATPGNTTELADRLADLLGDPDLRDEMGDRARKNVLRFSPDTIVQRWEDLFAFLER